MFLSEIQVFNKIASMVNYVSNILLSFREERCYVSGRLDGTAKYFYTSGSVETRIYEEGVLQGV